MPPSICPVCGAAVLPKATVCPECGSDDDTGWSAEAYAPKPDLPDEEFNYDEFAKREFEGKEPRTRGVHPAWWIVAATLALAYALAALLLF